MSTYNFRPQTFTQYIGQEQIKKNLTLAIAASKLKQEPLDHIIIAGASGLGKTSLAYLIAKVTNSKLHVLHGPNLQKPSDLISCLTQLHDYEIVFIDEIHSIAKEVGEILYPVLEDNQLNLVIGKDYNTRVINLALPKFTLIGATTLVHQLPSPLLNRFLHHFYLSPYQPTEICQIITTTMEKYHLILDSNVVAYLASFTRNNPRQAVNLLKHVYDYSLVVNKTNLTLAEVQDILTNLNYAPAGLNRLEINYLLTINELFGTQPVGLVSLSQVINEPLLTITNVIEPYLLQQGFLIKTPRGRVLTSNGLAIIAQLREKTW
ncbi:Holliday junction branch migration DNA helicase RuvB [Spiroplasma sp. DGKH1]|uniref:Holliday junction branch migration DNA helicase RuvB n=1 Tax=Spiroplasma sp. DGKH1 TaxID=3050074 RepID=UPI0034C6DC99